MCLILFLKTLLESTHWLGPAVAQFCLLFVTKPAHHHIQTYSNRVTHCFNLAKRAMLRHRFLFGSFPVASARLNLRWPHLHTSTRSKTKGSLGSSWIAWYRPLLKPVRRHDFTRNVARLSKSACPETVYISICQTITYWQKWGNWCSYIKCTGM